MTPPSDSRAVAFEGTSRLASGPLAEVALAAKHAEQRGLAAPLQVFDAHNSKPIDLDLRGSDADIVARLSTPQAPAATPTRGRAGRPRLGVVAREVTLLPRHWEWLAAQRGGASATLRKLVEQASRSDGAALRRRQAGEAVDRFMLAMAGDMPGYEEASRAFWRGEREAFGHHIETWPEDVRDHLLTLAAAAWSDSDSDA